MKNLEATNHNTKIINIHLLIIIKKISYLTWKQYKLKHLNTVI